MGCAHTRDQIYVPKEADISNRDINEEIDQLQAHPNHLQNYACGYQFSYKFQNAETSSSPNQHEAKKEEERAKVDHFMNICMKMKEKYMSCEIDEAYRLQVQVKKQYNEIDCSLIPQDWEKKKEEIFVLLEQIEDKYKELKDFQKQLQHQNNIQQNNLNVTLKQHQSQLKLCISTSTHISLDVMVATFASFLRYSQFAKFSTMSKEVSKFDNFRRLGEVYYDFPFCSKSTSYFQSTVFNRLNYDKSVLICYESLYKNSKLCDKLQFFPIFESEHKIDFSSIVCRVQQTESGKTNISLLFKIREDIKDISAWILEKMYKNIAVQTMKKLIERANAYGEETASESYEGDDEIYHYFHSILKGEKAA